MAFFKNVFKSEAEAPKKAAKKPAAVAVAPKAESVAPEASRIIRYEKGIGVLISPHLTEKTVAAGETGTYTFRIQEGANKALVRRAVEGRFGVKVSGIRITKGKSKKRRIGRNMGHTPGFTKAVVRLSGNERIELA